MFEVVLAPGAVSALRRMRRVDAREVLNAIERLSKSRIKRLRGRQRATCRLRVADHRVFYDVGPEAVTVVAILHKSETRDFYLPEENGDEGHDRV